MSFIGSGSCDVSECHWVYFILGEGTAGDVASIDSATMPSGLRSLGSHCGPRVKENVKRLK